jgi:ABC-type lipoprotein export system ATPase subunit
MLFQTLTVRENIIIKANAKESKKRISDKEIDKIACEFNLRDKLDKKVSLLSGGEKQRVQLGLLSMEHTDIILMDEPIANLDETNSKEIINKIKEMKAELIIIISHQYITTDDNYTTLEMKGGKLF